MSENFYISDTHFGHENIIHFCNRPFTNSHEMNNYMITQWNSIVGEKDIVNHGGDFAMKCHPKLIEEIVYALNGKIYMVVGSHDKDVLKLYKEGKFKDKLKIIGFDPTLNPHPPTMNVIKVGSEQITLCHYRMAVWPRSHYNSYHCFGHQHRSTVEIGKSLNICVEKLNYTPLHVNKVIEIMRNKPDNPDLIGGR